jgi:hypothetical protein
MDNENFLGQLKFHYKLQKNGQSVSKQYWLRILKKKVNAFNSKRKPWSSISSKTEAVRAYMGINDNNENTLFVGANKRWNWDLQRRFWNFSYDKEGNLGEESVVYDFQNHVL